MFSVGEQVLYRNCQVLVWIHQSGRGRDNSVAVRIRVIAKCELKLVFESHQTRHRVRTGAVHADLAVMVNRHERKRGIDARIDDFNVQSVGRVNGLPVRSGRAAQGIDPELQPRGTNGCHVNHVSQVVDIRHHGSLPGVCPPP